MDHFGIETAVTGVLRVYFQSSRRTGRTTSLVESVKDGDRVVFTNEQEARRVQRLCADRGVRIEIIVSDPQNPESLLRRGSTSGTARTLFDHTWVEQYYLKAIERTADEVHRLQVALSGIGEPHRETRRRAEEVAKWRG